MTYVNCTPPIVEAIMAYCDENNYRTILLNMRLYDRWQDTWYEDERISVSLKPSLQNTFIQSGWNYIRGWTL